MTKQPVHKPSKLKAWWTLSKYSFLGQIRNPQSLFFGLLFPFIFIIVFGVISGGNGKYEIAIRDLETQQTEIYEQLADSEVFELKTDMSEAEIAEALRKGEVPAALRITQTSRQVAPGVAMPSLMFDLDLSAADPQDAQVVRGLFTNIVNEANISTIPEQSRVASLETEEIAGRKYERIDFILPGQLSFALMTSAVFSLGFGIISRRKTLVIKRMFATPTPKWIILAGELTAKLWFAMVQASLIILVGHYVFKFTLADGLNTFVSMLLVSLVGLLVFCSFGLLVASVADSEDSGAPIANLITMPQLLLSGAFFPIDAFPEFLQPIARTLPMTYLTDAMRMIAFDGAPIVDVIPQMIALVIWGIIIYAIVTRVFRWE